MIIRDNFCYFCITPYFVTPHLKRLHETVWMRGHNIRFHKEIRKLSSNTPSYLELWDTVDYLKVRTL